MFSTVPITIFNFSVTFILSSANAFNLKQSKKSLFGKGLKAFWEHKTLLETSRLACFHKVHFPMREILVLVYLQ